MDTEEWRPIPSLGGRYLASSLGRIMGPSGKVRRTKSHKAGYRLFGVHDPRTKNSNNWSVSRCVCEAFHGPAPPGHEVDHKDKNRTNDRRGNLQWLTKAENLSHRYIPRGSDSYQAVLTGDDVKMIRSSPVQDTKFARKFGISRETIRDARIGRTWKHIK